MYYLCQVMMPLYTCKLPWHEHHGGTRSTSKYITSYNTVFAKG